MPQEQVILSEQLERQKILSRNQSLKCPRLVGVLYGLNCLPFTFIMAFLDALLLTKNEHVFLGLLDMLTDAGKDIEAHAQANGMGAKFTNYLDFCTQIGQQKDAAPTMRATVDEILALKKVICNIVESV